jgi:hypothetical protein
MARSLATRSSRTLGDGTVEDRCDGCANFRPRAMFLPGAPPICRDCRSSRRPSVVGPREPRGESAPTPDSPPPAPHPVATRDYVLSRGRYAGTRISEVPLTYLRSCAYGTGSLISTRAHIPWAVEVRMIQLYLRERESAAPAEGT